MKQNIEESMNQKLHIDENSDLMLKFLNKELTPEEQDLLIKQAADSKDTQELLKDLTFVSQATDAILFSQTPRIPSAEKKIQKVLNRTIFIARLKQHVIRTAALLTIPLLVSTAYLLIRQFSPNKSISMTEVTSQNKQAFQIKLSDGSIVHLHTGSTLRYPNHFENNERVVEIDGEGFFEVNSDPQHPFYVITPDQSKVKVYGTRFNVYAYRADSLFSVFLEKGNVDVIANGLNRAVFLEPQTLFTYNINTKQFKKEQCNPKEYTEWVNGKIIFNNTPINELAKRLSRHFGVTVKIDDKRLHKHSFNATFKDESIYQILNMLKLSTPGLDWTIKQQSDSLEDKPTIILRIKS